MAADIALFRSAQAGQFSEVKALVERYGAKNLDVWAAFREAMHHDYAKTTTWLANRLFTINEHQVRKLWKELEGKGNEAAIEWYKKRFAEYIA